MPQFTHPKALQTLAINLKKIRLESGISQEKLSQISGVDWSTISRIERGKVNTSISVVFALADALQIEPDILLKTEK